MTTRLLSCSAQVDGHSTAFHCYPPSLAFPAHGSGPAQLGSDGFRAKSPLKKSSCRHAQRLAGTVSPQPLQFSGFLPPVGTPVGSDECHGLQAKTCCHFGGVAATQILSEFSPLYLRARRQPSSASQEKSSDCHNRAKHFGVKEP